MQKAVEDFLIEHEKKQKELEQKEREELLINAGFHCKQYSPNNKYSSEYCENEFSETGVKYYKITALDVTEEEYEKIKSCVNKEKQAEGKKNILANKKYFKLYKALPNILLWTMIILSTLLGMVFSSIAEEFGIFFICTLVGAVLGFTFFIICKIAMSPIVLQTEFLNVLADKAEEK